MAALGERFIGTDVTRYNETKLVKVQNSLHSSSSGVPVALTGKVLKLPGHPASMRGSTP
jgi:hypothetical protein